MFAGREEDEEREKRKGRALNDGVQAPEIQTMYSLNMPVSQLRTKLRQEFERHRYVNKLPVVDMLLFQSHAEFQVSPEEIPLSPTRKAMEDFPAGKRFRDLTLGDMQSSLALRCYEEYPLTQMAYPYLGNVEFLEANIPRAQIL